MVFLYSKNIFTPGFHVTLNLFLGWRECLAREDCEREKRSNC